MEAKSRLIDLIVDRTHPTDIEIDVVTVDDERVAGAKRPSGSIGASQLSKTVCNFKSVLTIFLAR